MQTTRRYKCVKVDVACKLIEAPYQIFSDEVKWIVPVQLHVPDKLRADINSGIDHTIEQGVSNFDFMRLVFYVATCS